MKEASTSGITMRVSLATPSSSHDRSNSPSRWVKWANISSISKRPTSNRQREATCSRSTDA